MVSESHDDCVTMETGQEVNYSKFNLTSQQQISSLQPPCLATSDWKSVLFQ